MVQVAVMGHGVVGSGVVEVLTSHAESIAKRAKEEINIKYILDIREFPDSPLADRFTKNFEDILNDEEVKVVAEVMGGVNPAYDFVKWFQKKWVLLVPFVMSVAIETTQYVTGLGIAEFDDVFGNTMCGWTGVLVAYIIMVLRSEMVSHRPQNHSTL